jgi:hypothetical protein
VAGPAANVLLAEGRDDTGLGFVRRALALIYDRYWHALNMMCNMNKQLIVKRDGQQTGLGEGMMGTVFFTLGTDLLVAITKLLRSGDVIAASALLRSLSENAGNICYMALHDTLTPAKLAERAIAFQDVKHHVRNQYRREAGLFVDDDEYAAAESAHKNFRERYHPAEKRPRLDDWTGVEAAKKMEYVAKALGAIEPTNRALFTKNIQALLNGLVHMGPLSWQLLLEKQTDERITHRNEPQDNQIVMDFAVPLAVALSAAIAYATTQLWQSEALFALVSHNFSIAAGYLEPNRAKRSV